MDDDTGGRILERRTRLGLTAQALADAAGVDRGVLSRLEKGGNARLDRIRALERALDEYEHRYGTDVQSAVKPAEVVAEEPHLIRIKVEGVYGAKALIVEGSPEDQAQLEAMVDRIMRNLRASDVTDE